VLHWNVQRGVVTIPKSSTESRINENFDIESFELSEDDMRVIEALDQKKIFVNPIEWWGFPYF
jgi:diketogulonate reductase-like aldo/keto reductase